MSFTVRTCLFITHDFAMACYICSWIALILEKQISENTCDGFLIAIRRFRSMSPRKTPFKHPDRLAPKHSDEPPVFLFHRMPFGSRVDEKVDGHGQ